MSYQLGNAKVWDGAAWVDAVGGSDPLFEYVVIAGGGGGGGDANNGHGSGGGAGGYRSSVAGESSGGVNSAEFPLFLSSGSYTVSVGAGGAGGTTGVSGTDSYFGPVRSMGGGRGHKGSTGPLPGGSGGAPKDTTFSTQLGVPSQGYRSGSAAGTSAAVAAGGAGGAGGVGANAASSVGGNGGPGVTSSITGSAVGRAGGGAGATYSGTQGTATDGGGSVNNNGTVNTGGGAGGASRYQPGRSGGSGVVILKYPSSITLSIGAGLTSSTTTSGDFKITSFTAGTDTVTF